MGLLIMKIEEIKIKDDNFKPIRIEIIFESFNELKSLIAYLSLSKEYVQKYYSNSPNSEYYDFYFEFGKNGNSVCIKIKEIENISDSTLTFLNNLALSYRH